MYHGTDVGTYIMICTIHGNALVPKNIAHVPKLQCQGWEGTCDSQEAWRAHMNTQYINEEQNYNTLCPECWKACDEHWKEMWQDYYSNCMQLSTKTHYNNKYLKNNAFFAKKLLTFDYFQNMIVFIDNTNNKSNDTVFT